MFGGPHGATMLAVETSRRVPAVPQAYVAISAFPGVVGVIAEDGRAPLPSAPSFRKLSGATAHGGCWRSQSRWESVEGTDGTDGSHMTNLTAQGGGQGELARVALRVEGGREFRPIVL